MKKYIISFSVLAILSISAVYVAANSEVPDKTFSKEELSKFSGKNGAKAYVAIDGVVYDVTLIKQWKGGKHKMGIRAGKDLSKMITKSPHGKAVLKKLPKRGYYKP